MVGVTDHYTNENRNQYRWNFNPKTQHDSLRLKDSDNVGIAQKLPPTSAAPNCVQP